MLGTVLWNTDHHICRVCTGVPDAHTCLLYTSELNAKYTPEDSTNLLYFYKALTQEHILLNEYVSDWEESIRCVGNLLLKDHYLTQNYINTMIDLVKENGPYIVFSPGFVIAHAGPEDGAEKLGVSVIRLVEPIEDVYKRQCWN